MSFTKTTYYHFNRISDTISQDWVGKDYGKPTADSPLSES